MFRFNSPQLLQNNQQSKLYNEKTFYNAFMTDLARAKHEVIIESPFITKSRFDKLLPIIVKLRRMGVAVTINTRDPQEHDGLYTQQAYEAVRALQEHNVRVLYTAKLHRKVAIIDRKVIWEGSLNILSFSDSCEMMRRTVDEQIAKSTAKFMKIY